jgi:hypothetical protein
LTARQAEEVLTMSRIATGIAALSLLLSCGLASGAKPVADEEVRLLQSVEEATWPAEIVRLSNQYLKEYPRGLASDAARSWQRRAAEAMRVLNRGDVQLYRSAFQDGDELTASRADIRDAALGEQAAAIRMAHRYQKGLDGLPEDSKRYVGWLQFASVLGSDAASYELALHFRKQDQPVLAAQYEARARQLGYNPPLALDHIRK